MSPSNNRKLLSSIYISKHRRNPGRLRPNLHLISFFFMLGDETKLGIRQYDEILRIEWRITNDAATYLWSAISCLSYGFFLSYHFFLCFFLSFLGKCHRRWVVLERLDPRKMRTELMNGFRFTKGLVVLVTDERWRTKHCIYALQVFIYGFLSIRLSIIYPSHDAWPFHRIIWLACPWIFLLCVLCVRGPT